MRNWLLAIIGAAVLAAVPLYEVFQWTVNYYYVPEGKSLLLRYKGPLIFTWGNTNAATGHFAGDGEIGVKETMPGPGRHFYCPIWWERTLVDDVVVQPGQLAVVTSKMGDDLPSGQFLLDGDLGQTASRGILRRTFGPGRYRINPYAYDVKVVETNADRGGQVLGLGTRQSGLRRRSDLSDRQSRGTPQGGHPERHAPAGPLSDQSP